MELWLIVGMAAVAAVFAFLLWRFGESKAAEGRAEAISEVIKQENKDARKASEVMAEHRSDDDTAGRMQRGDF